MPARSAAHWPAGWRRSGVSTVVVDRAALPPMEHPAFDGRAYAIASRIPRAVGDRGLWQVLPEPACPILDIRVSDGRVGRRPSPLFLHFDHREAGAEVSRPGMHAFGWMVEAAACASR